MGIKRHRTEEMVAKLRQVEVPGGAGQDPGGRDGACTGLIRIVARNLDRKRGDGARDPALSFSWFVRWRCRGRRP